MAIEFRESLCRTETGTLQRSGCMTGRLEAAFVIHSRREVPLSRLWSFERDFQVRFSHCDPAGIVFFPQYLVMFVGLVEDWFTNALDVPYSELIMRQRVGVPTVKLDSSFHKPSMMGDMVTLGLTVLKVGNSSFTLDIGCRRDDELRVKAQQVLVTTSLETHKAIPIPERIRTAMAEFQKMPLSTPEGDTP